MASLTDDAEIAAREFKTVAQLFNALRTMGIFAVDDFTELSMGMSGDLDAAIGSGSTMVRVGTALFGPRA